MNRIYKVIWSKVKRCYVVASELAKSHSKASDSKLIRRAVAAGVLASVLSCGAVMPVYAAAYSAGGGSATGTNAIAIGNSSKATNINAVAIGNEAVATGEHAIAIGRSATDGGNGGANRIAIGRWSQALSDNTIALGCNANASSYRSISIGNDSIANGLYSVSIGYTSVANESDIISFGHKATDLDYSGNAFGSDLTRRIINVADGIDDTDAATWGQTKTETRPADNGNYVICSIQFVEHFYPST